MKPAVRRPLRRSARIWSRGTRTSAWMPVKKNSPSSAVYLASRSSISTRPAGSTSVIDAPFSTSAGVPSEAVPLASERYPFASRRRGCAQSQNLTATTTPMTATTARSTLGFEQAGDPAAEVAAHQRGGGHHQHQRPDDLAREGEERGRHDVRDQRDRLLEGVDAHQPVGQQDAQRRQRDDAHAGAEVAAVDAGQQHERQHPERRHVVRRLLARTPQVALDRLLEDEQGAGAQDQERDQAVGTASRS